MAAARHLIALLQSHIDGDDEHFLTIALQAAAGEARQGHGRLAQQLRDLVDAARARQGASQPSRAAVPLARPKGDLANLVSVKYSDTRLSNMVLPAVLDTRLRRILLELRQQHRLQSRAFTRAVRSCCSAPPARARP